MIDLIKIDEEDFKEYLEKAVKNYAKETVDSGSWNK